MARPLRLQMAGVLYHVTARGNRREAIYRTMWIVRLECQVLRFALDG